MSLVYDYWKKIALKVDINLICKKEMNLKTVRQRLVVLALKYRDCRYVSYI